MSEDLGVLSTSDAGSFVAEESYVGQANLVTAAAGEGCCRGWDCGDTALSPTSLLPKEHRQSNEPIKI